MKILIVSNEFPPGPGGVGTHAYLLATHLATSHEVTVIASQNYSSDHAILEFNRRLSVPLIPFRTGNSFLSKAMIRLATVSRVLRSLKPDVVIPTGSDSIWVCTLLLLFQPCRQVVVAHGGELNFRSSWRRRLTLWGCKRSDRVICVSAYTAGFLYRYGISSSRVTVIPNGGDNTIFRRLNTSPAELRTQYGYSGRRVIITVGSLTERKGQDIVIRAMARVRTIVPEALYIMVGRCADLSLYQRLAEEIGVLPNVVFFGVATNTQLTELYNLSDVFILTSRHARSGDFEGFGIAVIEAALCGLPAIVTTGSGLTEAIVESVTGLSVAPDHVDETAGAIVRLLSDEQLRTAMAAAATKRAGLDYTWSRVADKYIDVLNQLETG